MERLFSLFVGAEQLKNAGIRWCIFEIANLFTLESFKAPESSRGTKVEHAKGDSCEQVKSGGRATHFLAAKPPKVCFGGLNAMKSASRQFGMRESPASKRRHDSRLADQSEIAPYSLAPENADESTFLQSTQSVQRVWPEFRDAAHSAATGEGGVPLHSSTFIRQHNSLLYLDLLYTTGCGSAEFHSSRLAEHFASICTTSPHSLPPTDMPLGDDLPMGINASPVTIATRLAKGRKEPADGNLQKGGKWWIDYFDRKRRRIQESSHSSARRDSEQLLALRRSEVSRGVCRRVQSRSRSENSVSATWSMRR